jgi:hypothetical protein
MHVRQCRPNRIVVRVCQGLESEVLIAPQRFDLKIGALIQCSPQPSSGPVPTASQRQSFLLPLDPQQLCLNVMFKSEARAPLMLEHSIEATIANLDACDRARYRSLIEPLALTLPSYLKTFSRPFSTSLATHFCSRVLARQHSYLQHLWPVLISRETRSGFICRYGDSFDGSVADG